MSRGFKAFLAIAGTGALVATIILGLIASRQRKRDEAEAAQLATLAAADRAYKQQSAIDDQKFRDLSARADKITLYEVANPFDADYESLKGHSTIFGYPIRRSITLRGATSNRLVRSLSERSTFLPPREEWTCLFEPHHVLILNAGRDTAVVVICVKCGDIEYAMNSEKGTTHSVKPEGNAEIAELLRKLLPELPPNSPLQPTRPRSSP